MDGEAFDKAISNLKSISRVYQYSELSTLVAECYAIIAIANLCEEYGVLEQIEGRNDSDRFFVRSVIFLIFKVFDVKV